jgi:hypothetical protein
MMVNEGVRIRKLGKNGKLAIRTLTLDPRTMTVRWDSQKIFASAENASIRLEDVIEVKKGFTNRTNLKGREWTMAADTMAGADLSCSVSR